MNRIFTCILFAKSIVLISYAQEKPTTIDYLGQQPPGMTAELFAPGLISTKNYEHSAPAFSPDGNLVLWTVVSQSYRGSLLEMKYKNGKWSTPYKPSFADSTADDYYPSFSADGTKLYFSSRRKAPAGYAEATDIRIWEVERKPDGWGKPVPFDTTVSRGQDYAHSITKNGVLYFSSALGGGTNWNIQRAEKLNGVYTTPVVLPYGINSVGYEEGPYIAPDESFLIFESQRPDGKDNYLGLYISFRDKTGRWGMPINMGPKINSGKGERFARLSPDGKYLFFGSFRNSSPERQGADIYWIDAKIIDEIKNSQKTNVTIEQPLGSEIIDALFKNDIDKSASLLKRWLDIYPNYLDAIIIYASLLRKQQQYAAAERVLLNNSAIWRDNSAVVMEKALVKFAENKDDEAAKLLAPVLVPSDQLYSRVGYLTNALFDMGKFNASDTFFKKQMAIYSHPVFWYNRACGYTHINQKDKAFTYLNKAIDLGYNDRKQYEEDPDLVPLQADARWQLLLKKLK